MNCRPLWTAKVSPIISGVMVERRLQVLMTRLLPASRAPRTFFSRCPSMNGPFFTDRDMVPACLLVVAALHDEAAGGLLAVAGPAALGGLAPRGDRVAALGLALAAAVRVVDGVHDDAAGRRADAEPPLASG